MAAVRRWLRDVLVALAAWLDPDPAQAPADRPVASFDGQEVTVTWNGIPLVPFVAPPVVEPSPLDEAARAVVARLDGEIFSSVSKRQLAFRELRVAFSDARASDLNFAIEDAVRQSVTARKEALS